VPDVWDLIVIGGGPAGSTVAAIAARGGLRVLLLEADAHPRVHVGESLLPGIVPILERMGALADVEAAGFTPKSGTTHWQWGTTPSWDLWFADTDLYDHAWLVERGKFDAILFAAAGRAGAATHTHAAVRELLWEGERLCGVRWRRRGEEEVHEERAAWTVDASGQAALVARALGLRSTIAGLQHQASWAHFERAGRLPPPREHQALFVAERDRWLWLFPLSPTRASVGVVRLDPGDEGEGDELRAERFMAQVRGSEPFSRVLGAAERVTPVRTQRDWSYRMSRVAGPGWLLVGDAAGFIDPVLSTGVFLAMHAGFHAAELLLAGREVAERYQRHHAELFEDLLRMVRFYYQQTLSRDDYFWESKRILLREDTELRPQKAFLILTSGLVRNLAFDAVTEQAEARRAEAVRGGGEVDAPARLGFVCFHLSFQTETTPAPLWLLIEPRRAEEPAMFRTARWQINCVAPRWNNDPLRAPALAGPLRALAARVQALDTVDEPLTAFWRRTRGELMAAVRGLGAGFEVLRVFGE
jgi:flavin-dependent dehydrogenase